MEFEQCVLSRRSIRHFEDRLIPQDVLDRVLTAGINAPSACNFQAWKFIVAAGEEQKKALENEVITRAPICVLVVYRNDIGVTGRKHFDYIQSAAAAIQNMLLAAHDLGLGAVWICHYPEAAVVRKRFGIPDNFDPVGCIALGYPKAGAENTEDEIRYHYDTAEAFQEHRRRYSLEQVVCHETFQTTAGDCTFAEYPLVKTEMKPANLASDLRAAELQKEIELIHRSWTYRLGRAVTFLPRTIRSLIQNNSKDVHL